MAKFKMPTKRRNMTNADMDRFTDDMIQFWLIMCNATLPHDYSDIRSEVSDLILQGPRHAIVYMQNRLGLRAVV